MSWVSLVQLKNSRAPSSAKIVKSKLSIKSQTVRIHIERSLLDKIGLSPEDRVDILAGTGDNSGMLRLERNDRGWRLFPSNRKTMATSRVVVVKASRSIFCREIDGVPEDLPLTGIDIAVVEDGLEFRLPWVAEPVVAPAEDLSVMALADLAERQVPLDPTVPKLVGDPLEVIEEIVQKERIEEVEAPQQDEIMIAIAEAPEVKSEKRRKRPLNYGDFNVKPAKDHRRLHMRPETIVPSQQE